MKDRFGPSPTTRTVLLLRALLFLVLTLVVLETSHFDKGRRALVDHLERLHASVLPRVVLFGHRISGVFAARRVERRGGRLSARTILASLQHRGEPPRAGEVIPVVQVVTPGVTATVKVILSVTP